MKHSVIAIIIARGGSRRVPRKNVRPFCNHPLVAWTIVQALTAHTVDMVYLSTDDDEIEETGRQYGLPSENIIRRPEWPDADQAAANRPYRHAIEVLEPVHGMDYTMVQLLPTSPLRKPGDIDRAVRLFRDTIGGMGHVIAGHKRRETFIAEDVMGRIMRDVITDKSYRYCDPISGLVNIANPRWYMEFTKALGTDLDSDLDGMMKETRHPERDFWYIDAETWQVFETDTPVEFSLCERLMEHYILKDKGMDVFYEYANTRDAI